MSSRTPIRPTQQTRSRRTLEALLDAAEALLQERTFPEISLAELVRRAGVTTGAFYSRFQSKDDLLPALYDRYLAWLEQETARALEPSRWQGRSRAERAECAAEFICGLFETRAGLLRAMVIYTRLDPAATESTDPVAGEDVAPQLALVHTLSDRLTNGIDEGVPPPRPEVEFAVYAAITLAREGILFPGLPMARALGLDRARLHRRLARQLEFASSSTEEEGT